MRFFREHALKSVWRPIIAFRNDSNNEVLDYKKVIFLLDFFLIKYISVYQFSLLNTELPPEVNILTIEPINHEKNTVTILFRIEHIYDHGEHPTFSKPIKLELDVSTLKTKKAACLINYFIENFQ